MCQGHSRGETGGKWVYVLTEPLLVLTVQRGEPFGTVPPTSLKELVHCRTQVTRMVLRDVHFGLRGGE